MTLSRRSVIAGAGLAASAAVPVSAAAVKDLGSAIEKARKSGGVLALPAGRFETDTISFSGPIMITGVPAQTWLESKNGGPIFDISDNASVWLHGIGFDGVQKTKDKPLVLAQKVNDLNIRDCVFINTQDDGLHMEQCAGLVSGNRFELIGRSAIFTRDGQGLTITGNIISSIGNNGIQVWTSEPAECGTIVANNRIQWVDYTDGGTGQNGNGIIIFRAGNVIVEGNRIRDCAFSGVRNNAGANVHIVNNNISRMGEVAIYCEFAFAGAVVSGNIIEDTGLGISITNFDYKGRLATVANNVVRRCKGPGSLAETTGTGIHTEGDAVITGNVVEDTRDSGLSLGWGPHSRTLMATGNIVRDARIGIRFSVTEGADKVLIANNRISGAREVAIGGYDHDQPVTGDITAGAEAPEGVVIRDNLVTG